MVNLLLAIAFASFPIFQSLTLHSRLVFLSTYHPSLIKISSLNPPYLFFMAVSFPYQDGCPLIPLYNERKQDPIKRIPFPATGELLPRTLYSERERDHALANGPYDPTN